MHFLSGIVVPILALAGAGQSAPTEAVSTDVEVPAKAVSSDGRVPQYYCAHTYHIMYTRYIVKGRGSPVHEKKLKKGISKAPLCSISGWNYHEEDDGNGGNDFDLTFNFPIFCQARLEKALFKTLGAQGVNCPQVDGRHDKPLVGIHDDLEPDSSK